MGKVYFNVNTTTKDTKKDVSIRIRYKEGKIDQSTVSGEKIKLEHWDLEKQSFRRTTFKGKDAVLKRLKNLESHIIDQSLEVKQIKQGWLFEVVDRYRFPEKYKPSDQADKMLNWCTSFTENATRHRATISRYYTTIKYLEEFNPSIDWDDIDMGFYHDFITFLEKRKEKYSKNTIGGFIKTIKVFMNAGLERGIHNNRAFQSSNFKKTTEETISIYLNEEELAFIYNLDLSDKPYLEKVRDQFIIGCWTGCRFSDLDKVKSENIDGDFIRIVQQKTNNRVVIPLHPVVRMILDKYDGQLPAKISNQKFNQYLKEIADLSNINGALTKVITKGGRIHREMVQRKDMVSSHTARRSFATNLYKSKFPSISIMAMTGHKTESAFLTYIKVTEDEHAQLLREHWSKQGGFMKVV